MGASILTWKSELKGMSNSVEMSYLNNQISILDDYTW